MGLEVVITFTCVEGRSFVELWVPHVRMASGIDIDHPRYFRILTHELGHFFGVGDTYVDGNRGRRSTGGLDGCTGKQPSSRMCAGVLFGEDDRRGIIWLYEYYYEGLSIDDCIFPDYEFEEETGGCRPKHLVIFSIKHGSVTEFAAGGTVVILDHDPTLDVNERDAEGFTPLHYVGQRGDPRIVEALLKEKDIKVNILNKDKRTPAQLARELGERELARMIEAHPTADLPPWSVTSKGKLTTTWGHLKKRY